MAIYRYVLLTATGLLFTSIAMADVPYVSMGDLASTVDSTASSLATVLVDVSIIAGICFVLSSFFKFHQHRINPQAVQISQGISLLVIGCGMVLLPLLIPTVSTMVFGDKGASISKVGGSSTDNLVGKPAETA